jgi:hypothetical protein
VGTPGTQGGTRERIAALKRERWGCATWVSGCHRPLPRPVSVFLQKHLWHKSPHSFCEAAPLTEEGDQGLRFVKTTRKTIAIEVACLSLLLAQVAKATTHLDYSLQALAEDVPMMRLNVVKIGFR